MKQTLFLSLIVSIIASAQAQNLCNNALKAGLVAEGLGTKDRTTGGWYSEIQQGNMIAGFRASVTNGAKDRVADDFRVASGPWRLRGATFFMYQTDATQLTIDGGVFEIYRKTSFGLGERVSVGTYLNTNWLDMYRIFNSRPDDTRRIQKVSVAFDAMLPTGDYYLVWAAEGSPLYTGPWQPYLTKAGAQTVPGANGLQSTNNGLSWFYVQDGLKNQDFPFWLDGTVSVTYDRGM